MIVTENEAKTKRCQEGFPASDGVSISPEAPVGSMYMATSAGVMLGSGASAAMTVSLPPTAPFWCLGSACMAWRWFDNLSDEAIKEPRGFCGKAGHP